MIRTFIALPAGIVRMNFWKFNIYTFLGSFPWCLGLAFAGYKMGEHWPTLRVYFHRFDYLIGGPAGGGSGRLCLVALEAPEPRRERGCGWWLS